jgi:transcriptional regulator with XRE-family HTH domain
VRGQKKFVAPHFCGNPVKRDFRFSNTIPHDSFLLSVMQAKPISFHLPGYAGWMKNGRPSKSERADFAARLRALRETAGLSQRDMAGRLGISQPSYVAWESYNVALKPEQITELAKVLGIGVAELFDSPKSQSSRGPAGKAKRVFETVSQLPRSQQQKILEVVEAMIERHSKTD